MVGAAAPTATRSSRRGDGRGHKQQRWSAAPSGTAGRTDCGEGGHGRERQRWSAPPRRQQRAAVVVEAGAATSGSVGQRRHADRIAQQPWWGRARPRAGATGGVAALTGARSSRRGGGRGHKQQRWSAPPRRQQRAAVVVGAGAATSGSVGQRRHADRIAQQPRWGRAGPQAAAVVGVTVPTQRGVRTAVGEGAAASGSGGQRRHADSNAQQPWWGGRGRERQRWSVAPSRAVGRGNGVARSRDPPPRPLQEAPRS